MAPQQSPNSGQPPPEAGQGMVSEDSTLVPVESIHGSPTYKPSEPHLTVRNFDNHPADLEPSTTVLHPQTDLSILAISIPKINATTHINHLSILYYSRDFFFALNK